MSRTMTTGAAGVRAAVGPAPGGGCRQTLPRPTESQVRLRYPCSLADLAAELSAHLVGDEGEHYESTRNGNAGQR